MIHLLDTNVLSELVRVSPDAGVVHELRKCRSESLFASAITRFELCYGASLRADGEHFWRLLQSEILPVVTWLAITQAIAERAGVIVAGLRRQGRPCGVLDPFIAATALEHDLTLVTRNTRHFESVPGLTLANWFLLSTQHPGS